MLLSSVASRSASIISSTVSGVKALRTCGRLMVILAIPLALWNRISRYDPQAVQSI